MYANLKGEIAKKGIQRSEMAKALGIHENSISNKINGKSRFTIEEAFQIKDTFFADSPVGLRELFQCNDCKSN